MRSSKLVTFSGWHRLWIKEQGFEFQSFQSYIHSHKKINHSVHGYHSHKTCYVTISSFSSEVFMLTLITTDINYTLAERWIFCSIHLNQRSAIWKSQLSPTLHITLDIANDKPLKIKNKMGICVCVRERKRTRKTERLT